MIFDIHIEQGRTDWRTLVNFIFQVEVLTSTAKGHIIVHAL
jgi:hypothetical protein